MLNRLKLVSEKMFLNALENYHLHEGYKVVISCNYIQSWEQLAEALGNAFQFPMRNEGMDGTWDWITDLDWLGEENNISIYLYEYKKLCGENPSLKAHILEWFNELVQYWYEDVKTVYLKGKLGEPKNFNVYLVD